MKNLLKFVFFAAVIAGEAVGLIHDIPPAAEIIDRIVAEAERIISGRRNSSTGVFFPSPLVGEGGARSAPDEGSPSARKVSVEPTPHPSRMR